MNAEKHAAIYALYPSAATIRGDIVYDANENIVEYDPIAVEIEMQRNAYKTQREAAYPSFAEQFDLLYHGGYDAWQAKIQEVKDKYPKPE